MSGESTVMPPRKLHDADVVYLYDGSFEGFLCCVFESFAQHEIPFAVWTPQRETATLYPVRDIETDSARAQRVFSALGRKLGRETEYLVSRDFLSGQEDKELLLIRFLHLAFALGPGTVKRMGHPDVAPLYEMKKSLDWEVDKFQGFVRFEEHDGMLGAVIHPKNYILPLLRGHFCSRFPEESFMIYDAVHQAVLLYQEHKAQLLERRAAGAASAQRPGTGVSGSLEAVLRHAGDQGPPQRKGPDDPLSQAFLAGYGRNAVILYKKVASAPLRSAKGMVY